jgi:hypothetical protein
MALSRLLLMKRPWRIALFVVVLLVLVAGASMAYPAWVADAGLDFWNLPSLEDQVADEARLGETLHQRSDVVQQRLSVRLALADELIGYPTHLSDVIAEYATLNQSEGGRMAAVRRFFPAATDEESTYLQVRCFVRSALKSQPVRCAATLARLDREFQRYRIGQLPKQSD